MVWVVQVGGITYFILSEYKFHLYSFIYFFEMIRYLLLCEVVITLKLFLQVNKKVSKLRKIYSADRKKWRSNLG